ncbi:MULTISPECIES: hypothetical protein [Enterobacteriaceae]|uniref:hypothetical protein n=1 Tax=Enterobacteriaceae TaxID=543 RepID=UPI00034F13DF|nr:MULTISPECIES: hypothetical protein [Enterobacteriaceae]AGN87586.1 hypothetical protein H650_21410 [Enterobacter sp. R4-368]MCZ3382839.1 hypothetical protein [Kosakonia sp. SOY2]PDO87700.1 hypothetical protein BK797_05760 [Kosakonia sacchari]QHM95939.1 hypothetical protein FGE25_17440 [Kosakonia sacchari]
MKALFNASKVAAKASPLQAASAAKEIFDAWRDLQKYRAEQETARHQITRETDVQIARIQAQKEVLLEALNQDFALRQTSLTQTFAVLDKALETNNLDLLDKSLGAIVAITQQSSVVSLKSLHATLQDSRNVIDL